MKMFSKRTRNSKTGLLIGENFLLQQAAPLKPPKCSYYLILFRWKPDGTWLYEDNTVNEDLTVGVPLADGNFAEIEHLPITSAVKTFGSMMCPAGLNKAAIERMQS
jgi:hypothetical protein